MPACEALGGAAASPRTRSSRTAARTVTIAPTHSPPSSRCPPRSKRMVRVAGLSATKSTDFSIAPARRTRDCWCAHRHTRTAGLQRAASAARSAVVETAMVSSAGAANDGPGGFAARMRALRLDWWRPHLESPFAPALQPGRRIAADWRCAALPGQRLRSARIRGSCSVVGPDRAHGAAAGSMRTSALGCARGGAETATARAAAMSFSTAYFVTDIESLQLAMVGLSCGAVSSLHRSICPPAEGRLHASPEHLAYPFAGRTGSASRNRCTRVTRT